MLQEVSIANFKSIGEPGIEGLELKPLTLLVGPNGGGKSAILEAITSCAQAMGADINPSIMPFLPSFQPSFERLVHQQKTDNEIRIEMLRDNGERWRTVQGQGKIEKFGTTETGLSLPKE